MIEDAEFLFDKAMRKETTHVRPIPFPQYSTEISVHLTKHRKFRGGKCCKGTDPRPGPWMGPALPSSYAAARAARDSGSNATNSRKAACAPSSTFVNWQRV
jgi:hypothetical protein